MIKRLLKTGQAEASHKAYCDKVIDGEKVEYFEVVLSDSQLSSLQSRTTKVLACLEVLPVVAACNTWSAQMRHRRVFFVIDNDAERAGLVNMTSEVMCIKKALLKLTTMIAESPFFPWYARVASPSNIADEPSRGKPLKLFRSVATFRHVDITFLFSA